MPTPNRYLNEIQRANVRAERHEAATRRGAKNDFQPAPEWLTSINIQKWSKDAVLVATPKGAKWIPLSAVRGWRSVRGADMVIPFGYTCDGERREIAAWWMNQYASAD